MECEHKVIVSFRGEKTEIQIHKDTTVQHVKEQVAARTPDGTAIAFEDVKLLHKGKKLSDDSALMVSILPKTTKRNKAHRLMAMGLSSKEAQANNEEFAHGLRNGPRVRDDLSEAGKHEMLQRKRLGRQMMEKSNRRTTTHDMDSNRYGFGGIETLPNLPDEAKARAILTELSQDPGVLACMKKNKWSVGALAELYPKGKVGESAVCVMGLNENKGQRILLRLRTDDLKGFRKSLSIRKVLYHELSHNVHSEHDQKFFQLMRQIERECTELDWTNGDGMSVDDDLISDQMYSGGTYRLGGSSASDGQRSARELAAQAALMRMTAEEAEIEQNCGCQAQNLFLPPSERNE